jgi:hypothetical protein
MSLLDDLTQWIDKDRQSLTYVRINPARVERQLPELSLTAGVHYIRLRLANMFLKKEIQWFSTWYPAVHSIVRFNFGSSTIEVPNIADATRLGMTQTQSGDVIARNFVLTPTVPFNGGTVSLSAGLFALEGQNYLAKTLKVLSSFAGLLNVPQLSLALNVVQPLALGIQDLLGPGSGHMHLSLHDSFSEGELKSGYYAAIRAPQNSVDANDLVVINDELHLDQAGDVRPFTGHDHMLFRVELFDKRDDWENLTSIQEPFQEALTALRDQSQATHYIRTALLRATLSPDLTSVDKRRVVDRLIENYEEAQRVLSFKGAVGAKPPTLDQVMRQSMSTKMALGRGEPTVNEVFRAVKGATSDDRSGGGAAGLREESRSRIRGGGLLGIPEPEASPSRGREARRAMRSMDPFFYFATRGDGVRGDQVELSAEFELIFNYGIPGLPVLAKMTGGKLEDLLKAEKAELDIVVIPRGFTVTDSKWAQRASFVNGAIEKEVVFHLRAADEVNEDSSIYIIFESNGAVLYEFPIPLRLVKTLDVTAEPAAFPPLEFDLDELSSARCREQREARLAIFADGDKLSIFFDNLSTDLSFQVTPKIFTRASLADFLGKTKASLDGIPDHLIWTELADSMARPAVDSAGAKAFRQCLEGVATAGWTLYSSIAEDPDMQPILKAIDDLPPGSTLSIRTDCAFLPWEIVNPSEFNMRYSDALKAQHPVQTQNFWGNKFSIECLLAGQKQQYKTPSGIHEASPASVSMNIYRTIDDDFADRKVLPGQSHETFSAELAPTVKTEVRKTGGDIRQIFETANEATLIYLFCHGQNDKALDPKQQEKLEVDKDIFVSPIDLPRGIKYPRGPIVFLNSCSSGSFSPLAFSTFLSAFRDKQALGLIATSFPIPITFGSAFGQELMRRYFKNKSPIGKALLKLRQEQLANGNPLGLFYSLQCPADITAHKV